jgi:hypothetical protein
LGVLGDGLPVDARLVVKSLGVGQRDQVREVVVALQGLGDELQMVEGKALPNAKMLREERVEFAADEGVDGEDVAVVGHGHRRMPSLCAC